MLILWLLNKVRKDKNCVENLQISSRYLTRIAKMNMTLEIELGITGGEEDGVDHSGADHARLYTHPEDVLKAYDALNPVGSFTVAAAFGNTHGVYLPGNVKLKPTILRDSQKFIAEKRKTGPEPVTDSSGSMPAAPSGPGRCSQG